MNSQKPILYSFRRCPYAMRARMTLRYAGISCELREVILKDKPIEFVEASVKATVPVLVMSDGTVLEESLDIMHWSLSLADAQGWKSFDKAELAQMDQLIQACDGDFKSHLDQYKYIDRHISFTRETYRHRALPFLQALETRLQANPYLFAERLSFADIAIFPFVRQFVNVDPEWFESAPYPALRTWLKGQCESPLFKSVMKKYPVWKVGNPMVMFG